MEFNREPQDNFSNKVSGVLIVDKPVGMTSHDVVQASAKAHILIEQDTLAHLIHAPGVLVVLVIQPFV